MNEERSLPAHLWQDEWVNSLTHGAGLVLSLWGLFPLILLPFQEGNYWKLLNFGVFGISLVLLYAASTIYHAVRHPPLKQFLRLIDHCAIYLLIAGSYTPFTMLLLEGAWRWTLFGIIWGLAFGGILLKIFAPPRLRFLSTSLYLIMGWLIVVAAEPLVNQLAPAGLYLLVAGGLFYTFGVVFYALDNRRFFHAIWHLFVMSGSACHYCTVLLYLP